MKYTVVWLPGAKATLANLWLQAVDKQAVADASDYIDAVLPNDPETRGKPMGNFFVSEETPLAVLYEVDRGDCMVRVLTVKRI